MQASNDIPTVIYVADAYCGWCWGFGEGVAEFEAANRDRVRFTVISGGLFTGERAGPISLYPHIAEANARIARLTGAAYGQAYQQLLDEGAMVMDSTDAAAALAALREQAPERAIHWLHRLQEAFYVHGRSLSDPKTIADIAESEGLNAQRVLDQLADGSAAALAQADFVKARALGVSTYPTLLFVDGAKVTGLPAMGTAPSKLNEKLDALLA